MHARMHASAHTCTHMHIFSLGPLVMLPALPSPGLPCVCYMHLPGCEAVSCINYGEGFWFDPDDQRAERVFSLPVVTEKLHVEFCY